MSAILRNLYNKTCKQFIINALNTNVSRLNRVWYGVSGEAVSEGTLAEQLKNKFPMASKINVTDVSGGCGAMFEIYVETVEFKGLSVVKQHQSITDTLKEDIKKIHGLRIQTKVP